jgi:prepilin-type N-terminal cleavage/methylation domain-containing protein
VKGSPVLQKRSHFFKNSQGFSLIESMVALIILTFGLLATGQILFTAARMGHLARAKSTAVIAAQSTVEFLSDLYRRNPAAEELMPGSHGPISTQVTNPVNDKVLDRYSISWISEAMPNSRQSSSPQGCILSVRVTPLVSSENERFTSLLNKTLTVTTLVSPEAP